MNDFHTFFAAIHPIDLPENEGLLPLQIGSKIEILHAHSEGWGDADIVIIGCGEQRGHINTKLLSQAPDAIRKTLYRMFDWHDDIKVADAGNLLQGATIADSRAALTAVLQDLHQAGKVAIVIGGSQDLTLEQYKAFEKSEAIVDAAVIDMLIDLNETESIDDTSYLMEMLTGHQNFIRNFTHIGFQSYYVNPLLLQTLDSLKFDCIRLGHARENLEEIEPTLRQCDLLSVDMKAMKFSDAPFLEIASPNGFTGDEMCQLMRYAGMAQHLSSLGIYGYIPENDKNDVGAQQIAQMLWYFVDGYRIRKHEAPLSNTQEFLTFDVVFADYKSRFLKSKRTNRWWMQMPDGNFVPCSYNDYATAAKNEMPERWLREQERII